MICILYIEVVSVLKILTSGGKPKEEHEISQSKNTESNQVHKITYTRVVPKLMPPIYFHGNYTRYKEHNNTI